ncbi:MAG: peptidyl-prolyl cis-trans isomerase [Xanthomonadales bacterium]|nr:peptidyl-prolyl cis-trans isomerase [Xanthomonadales bacterium]
MNNTLVRRLLREPLFHFIVIGWLMFLAYNAMNPSTSAAPLNVITINAKNIERIRGGFIGVWKREPEEAELSALIADAVREEVYYREALALGLDKGDALVKRRMRLKLEFLMDSASSAIEPVAGELEALFAASPENYLQEARVAFEQIYLGENPDPADIKSTLAQIQAKPDADIYLLARRSQLPLQLGLATPDAVSGVFGRGFFDKVSALEPLQWTGPVSSSYGVHIVRVLDILPAQTPKLAEVHALVLRDWRTAKRAEIQDRDYAERLKRYVVEINRDDSVKMVTQ